MLGLAGVTAIDCSVGGFTVRVVEPLTLPDVAVIVLWPAPCVVARPAPLMVATPLSDEDQLTLEVRFCVVPSLKLPVAVNC